MDRSVLEAKAVAELREIAQTLQLKGYQRMKKADLIDLISDQGGNGSSNGGSSSDTSDEPATQAERVRARRRGAPTINDDDHGDRAGQRRDEGRDRDEFAGQGRDRDEGRGREESPDQDRGRGEASDNDQSDEDHGNDQSGGDQGQDDPNRSRNRRRGKNRKDQYQENLDEAEVREGVLDLLPEGYGFLRTSGYHSGQKDVYVSQSFVRRYGLRRGDRLGGPIRSNNRGKDKFPALGRVDTLEGEAPNEDARHDRRVHFNDLTPLFPTERLTLELNGDTPASLRVMDLIAPLGKGQRGLIVAPPKAGRTTLMAQLASAIEANHPEAHLLVVLVDERPEEVTDFQRTTRGEVVSSTFDQPAEDHTQVAELALERAKRLVEQGDDVIVLLDSITRLGHAYNITVPTSGRTLAGGIDANALHPLKRFFGAARNIEDGGSLTVIATALIDSGAPMDDLIREEFAGTANMEVILTAGTAEGPFPAIDVKASGTLKQERLLADDEVAAVRRLRTDIADMDTIDAFELIAEKAEAAGNNAKLLTHIAKSGLR